MYNPEKMAILGRQNGDKKKQKNTPLCANKYKYINTTRALLQSKWR